MDALKTKTTEKQSLTDHSQLNLIEMCGFVNWRRGLLTALLLVLTTTDILSHAHIRSSAGWNAADFLRLFWFLFVYLFVCSIKNKKNHSGSPIDKRELKSILWMHFRALIYEITEGNTDEPVQTLLFWFKIVVGWKWYCQSMEHDEWRTVLISALIVGVMLLKCSCIWAFVLTFK